MYYAVKRVINSNPDTLEKQHAEDHAALNSDTQYAELVKQERKAARAYITCMFLFLLAFAATTALSVSPAPASLYAFIPLATLILCFFLARSFRSKKSEVIEKKGAVFCNHAAFASEYYNATQGNRIIACYDKVDDEDEDLFELTIVTVPKSQPKNKSEAAPTEHTLSFPFCGDSLALADHDNLVLYLDHEVLCFME